MWNYSPSTCPSSTDCASRTKCEDICAKSIRCTYSSLSSKTPNGRRTTCCYTYRNFRQQFYCALNTKIYFVQPFTTGEGDALTRKRIYPD